MVDEEARKKVITEAIQRLPLRQQIAIGLYYYEGLTDEEIGGVLGITPAEARQLRARALARIVKDVRSPHPSLRSQNEPSLGSGTDSARTSARDSASPSLSCPSAAPDETSLLSPEEQWRQLIGEMAG